MAGVLKWMIRGVAAILSLALVAVIIFYMLLSRSVPEYDKTLEVSGLLTPIEIVRDNANVPHIFGTRDPDVFFGLGYGARLLAPVMARPGAWMRLDIVIGVVMWLIALKLLLG